MEYKSDDMGMGAGDETANQGKPPEQESVTIPAELMGGMSPKKGDKMTFCCTGDPDESGGVPGYFESAKGDGGDDWEKGFMADMSPRNGETADAM